MKTFITILWSFLLVNLSNAQAPALTLVVEEITITEPAFSEIQSNTGGLPHCLRLYANFPDDYELQVVYGNAFTPMELTANTGFYQNPLGGPTSLSINEATIPFFPALAFDSWMTIGHTNDVNNSLFYLPLDGVFFDAWEAGGNLIVNDLIGGSIAESSLPPSFPPNTPDANGNVLIAQLTSTSDIGGCLNFQLRKLNPDGTIYDPPGSPTSETYVYNDVCFIHVFSGGGLSCAGDFDANGIIATSDLLLFMPDFGCTSECTKDLTNDGGVGTTDLLVFLGMFGDTCD